MSDIVEQLSAAADGTYDTRCELMHEAAAEITRLRADKAALVEALDGMLKVFIEDLGECGYDEDDIADHDQVKRAVAALAQAKAGEP